MRAARWALLFLGGAHLVVGADPAPPSANPPFTEKMIARLPSSNTPIVFKPAWDGFAFVIKSPRQAEKGKYVLVADGEAGPAFERIEGPFFSRTGKLMAYFGRNTGKEFAILNGERSQAYDLISFWKPVFSADETRTAFVARRNGRTMVVVGFREGPAFDAVWAPEFTVDGTHLAYCARLGTGEFVVVDGQRGPVFQQVGAPRFSPDGRKLGYAARSGRQQLLILASAENGWRGSSIYAREGRTSAEMAGKGCRTIAYAGYSKYEGWVRGPFFSPDGASLAISVKDGCGGFVIRDGGKGLDYISAGDPVFSANGRSMAYAARLDRDGEKHAVILNGEEGPAFTGFGSVVFSPDGARVAYCARRGKKWLVMTGDQPGPELDAIGAPVFSPDGTTVAYRAWKGRRWFIVAGAARSPGFDRVWDPIFSSDGRKVAFAARTGRIVYWKVMEIQ